MKKILSLLLIVTMLVSTINPVHAFAENIDTSVYEEAKSIADEKSKTLVSQYGSSSVQYAVIDNGEIVISGNSGVYSKTENRALTADNMYGIGSVSKMFVACAVMKLVEMGKLDLDTPIIEYIPNFKMADERYVHITARMLLNHSSGIYGSSFQNAFLFSDTDTFAHDNLLNALSTQQLKASPGEFSVYCNDGFTLAEILVEEVTSIDFTSFIHQYFTQPLNMTNTKTPLDDFDNKKLVKTYNSVTQNENPIENLGIIGTGGIYSTAEDLCRFSQIFTDDTDILSQTSIEAMASAEYKRGLWAEEADSTTNYGLGWDGVDVFPFTNYDIKAVAKGGDTSSYHTALLVLPDHNMSVVVMSSGGVSSFNQIMASEMLLSILKAKGTITEIKPYKSFELPAKADMPEELMECSGIYGATQPFKIDITPEGILSLTMILSPATPIQTFQYSDNGAFLDATGNVKISFVDEKSNGLTYFRVDGYSLIPGIGQMAFSEYQGQKLESNILPQDIQQIWNERTKKAYFSVNEKYSSQRYFSALPVTSVPMSEKLPGYMLGSKIINENQAVNAIKIPIIHGRDTADYEFWTENGIEYLKSSNSIMMGMEGVQTLYSGKNSICTISDKGYTRWFLAPEELAGQTIVVETPNNSGFAVYDAKGIFTNHSMITGKQAVLSAGSYIAFIGNPGDIFKISVQDNTINNK